MHDVGPHNALWQLFQELLRRNFPLGPDDLMALRYVLIEGFGWPSRSELRDVCRALWVKSLDEQIILDSLFEQFVTEDWVLSVQISPPSVNVPGINTDETAPQKTDSGAANPRAGAERPPEPATITVSGRLPPVNMDARHLSLRSWVLVPQYPLSFRALTQAWRRLRRPVRFGPAIELDVRGTIVQRTRTGVATPPTLVPRRRNTARVLLLVDRDGSMAPFQDFVDQVCLAIRQTAQLANSSVYYFHDIPSGGTNDAALALLPHDSLFPSVDRVLPDIVPTSEGWLYRDLDLTEPVPLTNVLREHATSHAVVIISDAGAARGHYIPERVVESLGFAKALRVARAAHVWLNPLPRERWRATSAAELARYVPMFPLDLEGTHHAVNVLRGQPINIERPV